LSKKEPCQSGLTYLFAKEAGASKPLGGSNPPGSAFQKSPVFVMIDIVLTIENIMKIFYIFIAIYIAMIATSFWEAYTEGRNAWGKGKLGWKLKIGEDFEVTAYHFWVFWVTFPALLSISILNNGWDIKLFGVLISAYSSGMILEDFVWYLVNPKVKFKELWTPFSDYYPWIRIYGKKIIPVGYVLGIGTAILSWYFLWK
jgi:hypothetical protein